MCVYSRTCAWLWRRSLFPCCVPGIEAAHDLQVNKPETRGATKHTHAHQLPHMPSHGLMLSRRCPLFSPSYTAWHSRPLKSLNPPPNTHTHSTSHGSLNTAYQRFLLLHFPFSHAGTLHSSGGCSGCKGSLASCKKRKTLKCFSVKYLKYLHLLTESLVLSKKCSTSWLKFDFSRLDIIHIFCFAKVCFGFGRLPSTGCQNQTEVHNIQLL